MPGRVQRRQGLGPFLLPACAAPGHRAEPLWLSWFSCTPCVSRCRFFSETRALEPELELCREASNKLGSCTCSARRPSTNHVPAQKCYRRGLPIVPRKINLEPQGYRVRLPCRTEILSPSPPRHRGSCAVPPYSSGRLAYFWEGCVLLTGARRLAALQALQALAALAGQVLKIRGRSHCRPSLPGQSALRPPPSDLPHPPVPHTPQTI